MKKVLPIAVLLIILGIAYTLTYKDDSTGIAHLPSDRLKVHFIDVGQGDSVLIQTPDGRNILVDAGPSESSDDVVDYLTSNGVQRIDLLVITHPHSDHIGGMPDVIDRFGVSSVLDLGYPHGSQKYKEVLSKILSRKIQYSTPSEWVDKQIGSGVSFHLVWPDSDNLKYNKSDINDLSIVLRLSYGKISFLLTSDIGTDVENIILSKNDKIRSTVLKVAHHGSAESTSNEFLEAVKPSFAVISVGADNSYGHPSEKTLRRISAIGAELYRTDLDRSIVFITDGTSVEVESNR
ncbi:MAG: ComEC/Rec2 family competence protein [Armatimonadota bacterium]